jgi:general secretion pathway protein C
VCSSDLAVGDKPPRPFRVGSTVDGELRLRAVALRSASIGPASGEGVFTLQLPSPAQAATGRLPMMALDGSTPVVQGPAARGVPPQAPQFQPPPDMAPPPMEVDIPPPEPLPQAEQEIPEIPEGAAPDGTPPPGDAMRPMD